jgi:predicted restriction endonuclease
MHEFDHQCPICGTNIPAMLIASHIKPFRDCAHIFECADHNNGLLLCRNHDYLFDQGYFSLNEDGTPIPVAAELIGSASPYLRQRMTLFLTNELGIEREDQIWIG